MPSFKTTWHFDNDVRLRRAESNRSDWIEHVLSEPVETAADPGHPQRTRYWGYIAELDKYMRVVTEADGAVLTAFVDGSYTRRRRRRRLP